MTDILKQLHIIYLTNLQFNKYIHINISGIIKKIFFFFFF